MLRILSSLGALIVASAIAASSASATNTGGCPTHTQGGFKLVSVTSLGIPPEQLDGIASLDVNNDGLTCIKAPTVPSTSSVFGGAVFRDNTVRAG
jgi:hypothetical protein